MHKYTSDIDQFAQSQQGAWLNNYHWQKVKIRPMPLGIEGMIQAAYFAVTNTLYCASDSSADVEFGSVIHELYHAYQRCRMGLIRYLLAKTFARSKLEAPAKAAELAAVAWMGEQRLIKQARPTAKNKFTMPD